MGVVGLWSGSTACSMPLRTQAANALGHIRSSVTIRSQTLAQDKIRTELVEHLLDVFAHTQDQDTIYAILQDLCTVREITEMSQRLEVARLLSEGASYLDIQEQTGASATTISRVSKCLNYGSGGYGAALGMLCGSQDEER